MRQLRTLLRTLFYFPDWSIRYKMLGGLFLAAIIPLLVLLGVNAVTRYQTELEAAEIWLERDAEVGGTTIQANLTGALVSSFNSGQDTRLNAQTRFHARALAENPDYEGSANLIARTLQIMDEQLSRNPDFVSIRLLTTDGQLLAQAGNAERLPSLTQPDQSSQPAYLSLGDLALDTESAQLIPPYRDPASGAMLLETVVAVTEEDTLYGYLIFTLNPETILLDPLVTDPTQNKHIATLGGEYLYLLDSRGTLLTPTQGLSPFEVRLTVESVGDEAAEEALGVENVTYLRDWGDGNEVVTGRHYTIPDLEWTIVAETRLSDVVDPIVLDLVSNSTTSFVIAALLTLVLVYAINRQLVDPIAVLTRAAQQIAQGVLETALPHSQRNDEIGQLNQAVGTMTENLRLSIVQLEERVNERTRDLELTTEIAREASTIDDIDVLLNHTVNLLVENFPAIYHAQVFLIDDAGEYANLVASTGEPGRQLLARQHRLAVGSVSVIGRVTERIHTVVARDTSESRVHKKNEFLPDTRAEMALPLVRGNRVLGALDIQSKQADAFNEAEQSVFETLAAQLAITIDNARRLDSVSGRLDELEGHNRMLTRTNWHDLLSSARRPGYVQASAGVGGREEDPNEGWSRWQRRAARQKALVVSPKQPDGTCYLALPVISRDEVVGVIEWQLPAEQITEGTRQMARELATRLATNLETVRLLERSERLAERERLVNEISGKLTSEPNVGMILQTAVQELSSVLQTPQVNIQLTRSSEHSNGDGPTENA